VYTIEDINDKRSSTNITNANKYLSSKYIKMTTIYRYDIGNPTLSPLDIDFYFDTQSIIMFNYYIDRCELWGFIREINSGISPI
jgi:hypothetical protein